MAEPVRETARYWRHPGAPGIDLLRARFVEHTFSRHTHETFAIGVIEAGVEEYRYGGSLYRAPAGSVVLVNPDVVHTGHAGAPDGWSYRMLYPDVAILADIAAELGRPGTPYFPRTVVDDPQALRLLRRAHRAAEGADRLGVSTATRLAFAHLLRAHGATGLDHRTVHTGRSTVDWVAELLRSRLTDPPSLEELATAAETSPFALLRGFRRRHGLPPHAYLNQVRIQTARALLDAGHPPAEVATRVGYADQAHLTRHFKRAIGVPPGAYAKARNYVQDDLLERPAG